MRRRRWISLALLAAALLAALGGIGGGGDGSPSATKVQIVIVRRTVDAGQLLQAAISPLPRCHSRSPFAAP